MRWFRFGYGGRDPEELIAIRGKLDALVLDARFSPFGKDVNWNMTTLRAVMGSANYRWSKSLGNANYQGGAVKLHDSAKATRLLTHLEEEGRNVILICACRRGPDYCHVYTVAALREIELEEIEGPRKGKIDPGSGLFE